MSKLPALNLMPGREKRLRWGHPWAFSNEVRMDAAAKALPPGGLVRLQTAEGDALGTAMFNPRTLIAARLIARDPGRTIDQGFLEERIAAALALRERLHAEPYYRLVHAEGDGLPGLIVDRYGDVLVVQLNTAGMEALREPLEAALTARLAPRAIVYRNESGARALEGLPQGVEGEAGEMDLIENGCRFRVTPEGGQKTGWFYDQRDNRAAVARLAQGARMLDAYCYAGGFGTQAAVAGASSVTFLDRSKPALERALANAALNGAEGKATIRVGDGAEEMEAMAAEKERFDIVVADPPAFVKSKKDLGIGLKAYRRMTRAAAALVAPGGLLFVASCSHNVEAEAFAAEVRAGLSRAQRNGRILRSAGAAPDHPVHPFLPETAYLKSMLLQLD